jgi:ribose transport system ATP-binding protein
VTGGSGEPSPAFELRKVTKSYVEGVPVLDRLDLSLARGAVTGLVGANGSGKSTLVRLLSGYHRADPGSDLVVDGVSLGNGISADEARKAGIRFVHQDSGLLPGLSTIENMLVGRYHTGIAGRIRWREERRSVQTLLDAWGVDAALDTEVGTLPLATVAKLAILRALRTDDDEPLTAVVLDEPTAALGTGDAQELLEWLRRLATEQDVGVLFISHRLDEIFNVADDVAVLRAGRIVARGRVDDFDHASLVEAIIGTKIERFYPEREAHSLGTARLAVARLTGGDVKDLSFEVHAGEVLGVTGLPGSGFDDVPYLVCDPGTRARGSITVDGDTLRPKAPIHERIRRGLILVPGDRKRKAVAAKMTVRENLTLPRLPEFIRRGRLDRTAEDRVARDLVADFGIKAPGTEVPMSQLSGGNQQKVVLGRWLSTAPGVLVLHEPTHGVDVAAKAEIFALIADATRHGMAVVIASAEYDDLANVCGRVVVLAGGSACADLTGDALTSEAIGAAAFGGGSRPAGAGGSPASPSTSTAQES